jgi:hypothetical protein
MKRHIFILVFMSALLAAASTVSALDCSLGVTLINQDPIHAVPGEYVRVVFQMTGLQNPQCNDAVFKVLQTYPFSLDPGVSDSTLFRSGIYATAYSSAVTIPYTLRVDPQALS